MGDLRTRANPSYALTSIPPGNEAKYRKVLASWLRAGLFPVSFNTSSEIPLLRTIYPEVEFVTVQTTDGVYGRPCAPITAMLKWAASAWHESLYLIINADIELRLTPHELKRAGLLSRGGLCYFIRWNYSGALPNLPQTREEYGIDAFLFRSCDLPDGIEQTETFLSMGQPAWDYWLPAAFQATGRPVRRIDFPCSFHEEHPRAWSQESWAIGVRELMRLLGAPAVPDNRLVRFTRNIRASIGNAPAIARDPFGIKEWVQRTLAGPERKLILELGSHVGEDTAWLASLPGATVHAFEPDPRNHQPDRPNVIVHPAAVSDRDGHAAFILSKDGWGREWTESSSLKLPRNHLIRYPVSFGDAIDVPTIRLDTIFFGENLAVDFVWADVQGAEREMVLGGREMFKRTRYLYTEYSDDEMYEGQATLDEILHLLPGHWRVLEVWPDDVLLENTERV